MRRPYAPRSCAVPHFFLALLGALIGCTAANQPAREDGPAPVTTATVDGVDCASTSEGAPHRMRPQDAPSITFRSGIPGGSDAPSSQFRCRLDGETDSACSSPQQLDGLSEGLHRYSVQAVAPAPAGASTPAVCVLLVDGTPPSVTFNASPQVDGCTTDGGIPVSRASGTVTFKLTDGAGSTPVAGLRDASCRLYEVGAGPATPISADDDCLDGSFVFSDLPGGNYELEVTARDQAGNTSVVRRGTFGIDASAPIVTFASPRAPVAPGTIDATVGCDGSETCTLFADILPGEATHGSFLTDLDRSTRPVTFACLVDGASQPCSPGLAGGYPIAELIEGSAHAVEVTAIDCVGNSAPASLSFYIDERPPSVAIAAPPLSSQGEVTLAVSLADATTNIQAAECLIDFDVLTGRNPDTGGQFSMAPCTFETPLPSQPGSRLQHQATMALHQLAPGRHRVYLRATDWWGHLSQYSTVDFDVDYSGARPGHVVAIGHDFVERNQDVSNLLGNAVALAARPGMDRGLNLLVLDTGGADSDAAQVAPSVNALEAITGRLETLGACGLSGACLNLGVFGTESPTEYSKLSSYLQGRDVLLVLDQNDVARSATIGRDVAVREALTRFVNRGGTAIVLDGRFNGQPSQTVEIVSGLLDAVTADGRFEASGVTATLAGDALNPLVSDVGGVDHFYQAPSNSMVFTPDVLASVVFSMCDPAVDCVLQPIVLDKRFPVRAPVGRTWSSAELLEHNDVGDATRPQLALNASGDGVAVWQHAHDNIRASIWASRYAAGSGWGAPVLIEIDDTHEALAPQVAIDGDGNALAVWESGNGVIWSNRYDAATASWDSAVELGKGTGGPKVAFDPMGNAMAVWNQPSGGTVEVWVDRYVAGTGLTRAAAIFDVGNGGGAPDLAFDGDGNAWLVALHWNGVRTNVYAKRYRAATDTWDAPVLIESDDRGSCQAPEVAIDTRRNNAVAVWRQFEGTRWDIRASHFAARSDTWSTAPLSLTATAGSGDAPQVSFDAGGNAIAVWAQAEGPRYDGWSNRYTAGVGWGTAERIEAGDVGDAASPQIAADAAGNAFAVWYQSNGTSNDVWVNRYTAGTGWSTPALLETRPGQALRPQVAVDGNGNAIALWDQFDGGRISIWTSLYR